MTDWPVYATITGPIVMVGFGSIGKGTLPLIERHFTYDRARMVVIDPDDGDRALLDKHGVRFIPHGWNTALGLAADLQLASANVRTDLVEYLTGSPFIDGIVETPWALDPEGYLPIPSAPGLGVSLNPDAVERHTGVRF